MNSPLQDYPACSHGHLLGLVALWNVSLKVLECSRVLCGEWQSGAVVVEPMLAGVATSWCSLETELY